MSRIQQKSNTAHILDIAVFCVLPFYAVWPLLSISLSISQYVFTPLFPPLLFFFCLPLHASCWWHFLGERLVCGWVTGTVTLHVSGLGCRSAVPDRRLVYRRRRDATAWLFQTTAVLKQGGGWGHDCADTTSLAGYVHTWASRTPETPTAAPGEALGGITSLQGGGVYAVSRFWGQAQSKRRIWTTRPTKIKS